MSLAQINNSFIAPVIRAGLSLARISPEPQNKVGTTFRTVLSTVGNIAQSIFSASPSGMFSGMDPGYQELLTTQIEAQKQLTLVSLCSNVEKSKHETQMAAVRNIRVG